MITFITVILLVSLLSLSVSLVVLLIRRVRRKPLRTCKICALASVSIMIICVLLIGWNPFPSPEPVERTVQTTLDFEVCDSEEPLVIDTYMDHSNFSGRIYVYDAQYLDMIYDHGEVTLERIRSAIDENNGIGTEYKPYFHLFLDRVTEVFPDACLDTLYHNLLTLEVVPCDSMELVMASWSADAYGCYVRDENRIYVPEDYEYTEGTWAFQVLFHEICHAMRSSRTALEDGGYYDASPGMSYNTITDEALNSVFAIHLFHYEERDVAYQLPSNYLQIMLECMDNYTLSDYINHSQPYFYSKLDETTGHNNYAKTLWDLIEFQRKDREDEYISIPKEEYYPIYDYICDLYYHRNITPDMTQEEAEAVAHELVEKVAYDVPEDFNLDTSRFYDNLNTYLSNTATEHSENAQ